MNSLNSIDMSYSLSYKVRNHIFGKQVYLKNRLGMNSTIEYKEPFHKEDHSNVFIDVELHVHNIYELRINPNIVTNSLDKVILKSLVEQIEYIKKNHPIDIFPNQLGEKILVNVPLTMACNYNSNGYQSDAFGFTIEFKDEAYPGFYKEDEYDLNLKDSVEECKVHQEGTFRKDFIFRMYRIVDNHRKIGPLWVMLGGESVKITPIIDSGKSDGIYIYYGTGAKPLKVINVDEINKETLMSYGLSKSRIDLENTPHSKLYAETIKENNILKKKNSELDDAVKQIEDKYTRLIDKLNIQITNMEFDSKEKDRIINRMKETIKDSKEQETILKNQTALAHKQEVDRLKTNQEFNNIQGYYKLLKEGLTLAISIGKLFSFG